MKRAAPRQVLALYGSHCKFMASMQLELDDSYVLIDWLPRGTTESTVREIFHGIDVLDVALPPTGALHVLLAPSSAHSNASASSAGALHASAIVHCRDAETAAAAVRRLDGKLISQLKLKLQLRQAELPLEEDELARGEHFTERFGDGVDPSTVPVGQVLDWMRQWPAEDTPDAVLSALRVEDAQAEWAAAIDTLGWVITMARAVASVEQGGELPMSPDRAPVPDPGEFIRLNGSLGPSPAHKRRHSAPISVTEESERASTPAPLQPLNSTRSATSTTVQADGAMSYKMALKIGQLTPQAAASPTRPAAAPPPLSLGGSLSKASSGRQATSGPEAGVLNGSLEPGTASRPLGEPACVVLGGRYFITPYMLRLWHRGQELQPGVPSSHLNSRQATVRALSKPSKPGHTKWKMASPGEVWALGLHLRSAGGDGLCSAHGTPAVRPATQLSIVLPAYDVKATRNVVLKYIFDPCSNEPNILNRLQEEDVVPTVYELFLANVAPGTGCTQQEHEAALEASAGSGSATASASPPDVPPRLELTKQPSGTSAMSEYSMSWLPCHAVQAEHVAACMRAAASGAARSLVESGSQTDELHFVPNDLAQAAGWQDDDDQDILRQLGRNLEGPASLAPQSNDPQVASGMRLLNAARRWVPEPGATRSASLASVLVMEAPLDTSASLATPSYVEHDNQHALRGVAARVLKCVGAVHAAGFVHCDIKPEHFVRFKSGWKLIDFGSACRIDTVAKPRFTLEYACPEFAAVALADMASRGGFPGLPCSAVLPYDVAPPPGKDLGYVRVTPAADLWSVGMVLHQLWHQRPFNWLERLAVQLRNALVAARRFSSAANSARGDSISTVAVKANMGGHSARHQVPGLEHSETMPAMRGPVSPKAWPHGGTGVSTKRAAGAAIVSPARFVSADASTPSVATGFGADGDASSRSKSTHRTGPLDARFMRTQSLQPSGQPGAVVPTSKSRRAGSLKRVESYAPPGVLATPSGLAPDTTTPIPETAALPPDVPVSLSYSMPVHGMRGSLSPPVAQTFQAPLRRTASDNACDDSSDTAPFVDGTDALSRSTADQSDVAEPITEPTVVPVAAPVHVEEAVVALDEALAARAGLVDMPLLNEAVSMVQVPAYGRDSPGVTTASILANLQEHARECTLRAIAYAVPVHLDVRAELSQLRHAHQSAGAAVASGQASTDPQQDASEDGAPAPAPAAASDTTPPQMASPPASTSHTEWIVVGPDKRKPHMPAEQPSTPSNSSSKKQRKSSRRRRAGRSGDGATRAAALTPATAAPPRGAADFPRLPGQEASKRLDLPAALQGQLSKTASSGALTRTGSYVSAASRAVSSQPMAVPFPPVQESVRRLLQRLLRRDPARREAAKELLKSKLLDEEAKDSTSTHSVEVLALLSDPLGSHTQTMPSLGVQARRELEFIQSHMPSDKAHIRVSANFPGNVQEDLAIFWPRVLLLAGHGAAPMGRTVERDLASLLWEHEEEGHRSVRPIQPRQLVEVLKAHRLQEERQRFGKLLQVVFLNACHSVPTAREVAAALPGISVIAWRGRTTNAGAVAFAYGFYACLNCVVRHDHSADVQPDALALASVCPDHARLVQRHPATHWPVRVLPAASPSTPDEATAQHAANTVNRHIETMTHQANDSHDDCPRWVRRAWLEALVMYHLAGYVVGEPPSDTIVKRAVNMQDDLRCPFISPQQHGYPVLLSHGQAQVQREWERQFPSHLNARHALESRAASARPLPNSTVAFEAAGIGRDVPPLLPVHGSSALAKAGSHAGQYHRAASQAEAPPHLLQPSLSTTRVSLVIPGDAASDTPARNQREQTAPPQQQAARSERTWVDTWTPGDHTPGLVQISSPATLQSSKPPLPHADSSSSDDEASVSGGTSGPSDRVAQQTPALPGRPPSITAPSTPPGSTVTPPSSSLVAAPGIAELQARDRRHASRQYSVSARRSAHSAAPLGMAGLGAITAPSTPAASATANQVPYLLHSTSAARSAMSEQSTPRASHASTAPDTRATGGDPQFLLAGVRKQ